jgi:phosphohistidine phosphatase
MIFLVHHADAVGPDVDPQRPLSASGRAHAERLAQDAAGRGAKPVAIWHSGKLRARQTAEAFLRTCNPFAEFSAIHGLQPEDPPEWTRDRLTGETRDVMVVGHMPHLPRLLSMITGRGTDFPQHGVVAVEMVDDGWRERWRTHGESGK